MTWRQLGLFMGLLLATSLFIILFAISSLLWAHEWYPSICCAGRDCRPVPCETIGEWQRKYSPLALWGMRGYSPDGRCHVCVGRGSDYPRCIFVPIPMPLVS